SGFFGGASLGAGIGAGITGRIAPAPLFARIGRPSASWTLRSSIRGSIAAGVATGGERGGAIVTSTSAIEPPVTVIAIEKVSNPEPVAVSVQLPSGRPPTEKCPAPSIDAVRRTEPHVICTRTPDDSTLPLPSTTEPSIVPALSASANCGSGTESSVP